jgi:hypothetical protein
MGDRSPERTQRPEWFAVAMKAFYDPKAAEDISATIGLDLDGAQFTLRLDRGQLEIAPGANGHADLTIVTDPQTFVTFLAGGTVAVSAEGDRELLERLPAIFPFGGPRQPDSASG